MKPDKLELGKMRGIQIKAKGINTTFLPKFIYCLGIEEITIDIGKYNIILKEKDIIKFAKDKIKQITGDCYE